MKTWSEKDFEQLGWHDNHIHGFMIRQSEQGMGELVLDIDYILEWMCPTSETFEFLIAPATLTFISVSDLKVDIDFAGPSAAMCLISIEGIERELKEYQNGYSTYQWRIPINWPAGEITFFASGFTQVLRSEPILVTDQYLWPSQRVAM